jgi:hypothetical protein
MANRPLLKVAGFQLITPGWFWVIAGTVNRVGFQGLFFERYDGDYTDPTIRPGVAGLYYARNRFYSPMLGRFIQRDVNETALPIITALAMNGRAMSILMSGFDAEGLYGDGMNLYLLAGGDPVNRRDPLGLNSAAGRAGAIGLGATLYLTTLEMGYVGMSAALSLYGTALAYGAQLNTLMYSDGMGPLALDPAAASAFGDDVWRYYEAAKDAGARAWDTFWSASKNFYNKITGPSGSGGNFWSNLDPRDFRRFLQSLQSLAAQSHGAVVRSLDEANQIYRELLSRGWRLADPSRGVETTDWVGGPHVNLVGPSGETVHFPVPPGFVL